MFKKTTKFWEKLCTFTPSRLFSLTKSSYSNRNVLRLQERRVFSDLFPDTSANAIVDVLNGGPQTVYAGFDPTADSLHVGNLAVLVNLLNWQRCGHNVIALLGGATAQIGDPSGKSTERPLMEKTTVNENCREICKVIENIFRNHEKYLWRDRKEKGDLLPAKLVNNMQWYKDLNALEFIGRIGRNFRVTQMLLKTSVKERIDSEKGISFTEFTYQILQAYDWLYLYKNYGCRFQIGGHDQMGNIVSGYDLIQRVCDKPVFGLTLPLLTSSEGDKFGKSAGNAIWLSEKKTSPFQLFQFFMRVEDLEVEKLLKLLTFLPLSNIEHIMEKHFKMPERRYAQRKLAEEVTLLVHGERGVQLARDTTSVLYEKDIEKLRTLKPDDVSSIFHGANVVEMILEPEMTLLDAALKAGCFLDDINAMRIISAGGFYVNYQKASNPSEMITPASHILPNKISLFRVGKKNYTIIKWHT